MADDAASYLQDILDAIAGIREVVASEPDPDQLFAKRTLRRAIERELEIISEASRRVPAELKVTEPDVRWCDIAGIGNVLRHDYQIVSLAILREVIERHLEPLEAAAQRMLTLSAMPHDQT